MYADKKNSLLALLSRLKSFAHGNKNSSKTTREIFSRIYHEKQWKGNERFYSGRGSSEPSVVQPYIEVITDFLKAYGNNKPRIVDLGCGDFNIGKNFVAYCSQYIGVDIVPDLIKKLKADRHQSHIQFICLDIVKDKLPAGDICFLRQVLQHLSNEQIVKILTKLKKYKTIFITEHYPSNNPDIVPNKDIYPGAMIRVVSNSGVYLDRPPFNVPASALQLILEVPGVGMRKECDQGIIRTYKLEFS